MISNETVKGYWKKLNVPEMFENKPRLIYDYVFIFDDSYIRNTHTLIKLKDGAKFLSAPNDASDGERCYSMKFENDVNWYRVNISSFSNSCLSCELTDIAAAIQKNSAILAGRYVLPVEDGYILISGEDFDGNEASRVAAGGFIVLEIVQVGKVFKLVKAAKIFSKTGTAVNASKRLIKHYIKEVSKEAVIDMSVQFVVNLFDEIIKNPNADAVDLAASALTKIDIKDAIVTGMIDFASMDNMTKTSFDCALRFFRQFENEGKASTLSIEKGLFDCAIIVGVRYSFKKLKGSEQIELLAKAIADAKNYDVIISKLSQIMSVEAVEQYIQTLTEYSILKGAEVVWK